MECAFPYEHTRPLRGNGQHKEECYKLHPAQQSKEMKSVMKKDLSMAFFVSKKQWILATRNSRRKRAIISERVGI